MTENFTPADLIYLYLDGEADSMQQTTMFAALASDPDLQQEFSEALSMRRAFEFERSSAKPPLYLSTRVFQDAGILPKAVGVGALGGGLWMWLRKAAIPVGTLVLGSVVTFFAMNWNAPSTSPRLSQTMQQVDVQSAHSQGAFTASSQSNQALSSASTSSNAQIASSPMPHVRSTSYVRDRGMADMQSRSNHSQNAESRVAPPSAVDQSRQSLTNTSNDLREQDPFMSPETRIAGADAYNNYPGSRRLDMVNVPLSSINVGKTNDFSAQINMAGANIAGVVPGSKNPSFLSDVSASLMYQLDERNAVGFGMSSVRHNISDNTNNGSLQNPQITTWTVQYQRSSAEDLLLGGQGFISFAVGPSWNSGTTMGIGDVNVGLSFPLAFLQLNTAFALQSVWYQSQSNSLTSNVKSSFVIGLGYNW